MIFSKRIVPISAKDTHFSITKISQRLKNCHNLVQPNLELTIGWHYNHPTPHQTTACVITFRVRATVLRGYWGTPLELTRFYYWNFHESQVITYINHYPPPPAHPPQKTFWPVPVIVVEGWNLVYNYIKWNRATAYICFLIRHDSR